MQPAVALADEHVLLDRKPAVIEARDVSRRYGEGDAAVDALAGVTTSFERDRFTAIMGCLLYTSDAADE